MDALKDLWDRAWWGKVLIVVGVLFLCGFLTNLLPDSEDGAEAPTVDVPVAAVDEDVDRAADVDDAVEESAPEPTSEPTAIPPTEEPEPPPEPITLSGSGQTATDSVTIPFPMAVLSLSHNGGSNFIVQSFSESGEDYLVNEIGAWTGQVLIPGDQEVVFDVDADGAWTIDIAPPMQADSAAFAGSGSLVSGLFDPPSNGPWEVQHDGESNFIVQLVCAGGTGYVQNEIGAVSGSTVVRFDRGPCMWVVDADGNWSLSPR